MTNEEKGIRLLITGGRDFDDVDAIRTALMDVFTTHIVDAVVVGDSRGVDRIAADFAKEMEYSVSIYKALWGKYGKSAGPRRNGFMLKHGEPTHVIAFPGGRGTADMVNRAVRAGLPIRRACVDAIETKTGE